MPPAARRVTFGFQGSTWLADIAPELLDDVTRARVARAKLIAARRAEIEATIPEHLLYTAGWPTVVPTREEADLVASVRREVGNLLGLQVKCTDADAVLARYAELMALNATREAAKAAKAERKAARVARLRR